MKYQLLFLINVKDISTGGLRIISEYELLKGSFIDLTIPGIETLGSAQSEMRGHTFIV